MPEITPGKDSSEHALAKQVINVCHAIAAVAGIATPIVAVVGTPLGAAIVAALGGVATATAAYTASQYSEDRSNVKSAAQIGGQLAEDLKPLIAEVKAVRGK